MDLEDQAREIMRKNERVQLDEIVVALRSGGVAKEPESGSKKPPRYPGVPLPTVPAPVPFAPAPVPIPTAGNN